MAALESFLILLIVVGIVGGLVYLIARELPLPDPFKRFVLLGILLLCLIILLVEALPLLHLPARR